MRGVLRGFVVAALGMALCACPRTPKVTAKRVRPKVLAELKTFAALEAHAEFRPIASLFPVVDQRPSACAPAKDISVLQYPLKDTLSRAILVRYQGCCETHCRPDPKTGDPQCGQESYPLTCEKDLLLEAREGRFAQLVSFTSRRYDPDGGTPKVRVFLLDLDGDGRLDLVRWEELPQHRQREWFIQAFRGTPDGIRRIANIRFHHLGNWMPNLDFPRDKDGNREIEISVQEIDLAQRRTVVKRRVYKYDPLVQRFVIADTVVFVPEILLKLRQAKRPPTQRQK